MSSASAMRAATMTRMRAHLDIGGTRSRLGSSVDLMYRNQASNPTPASPAAPTA